MDQDLTFSHREMEIIYLTGHGYSPKDIGALLSITPNTVNNYKRKMLKKAKCETTNELVLMSLSKGLINSY